MKRFADLIRRFLVWAGRLLLFVGVLLSLTYIFVRSEAGRQVLRQLLVRQIEAQYPLRVEGLTLSGNVLRRFWITKVDVRMEGLPFLRLDTLEVTWRPWAIWRKTVAVDRLVLHRPMLALWQDTLGRWNYEAFMVEDTAQAPPTWRVRMDSLYVHAGRVAMIPAHVRDTVKVTEIQVDMGALDAGEPFSVRIDTVDARLEAPDAPPVTVGLRGRYEGTAGVLERVRLQSPRSYLEASGSWREDSLHLSYRAPVLVLSDVQAFFPRLNPDARMQFEGEIGGVPGALRGWTSVRLGDGAQVMLEARPVGDLQQLALRMQRFDMAYLIPDEQLRSSLGLQATVLLGDSLLDTRNRLQATLAPGFVQHVQLRGGRLDVRVAEDASLRGRLRLQAQSATLTAEARVSRVQGAWAYDGSAVFREVMLSDWLPEATLAGVLNGEVLARGTVAPSGVIVTEGRLRLLQSHLARIPIDRVDLRLKSVDPERMQWQLKGRLAGGALQGRGSLWWASVPGMRVEAFRWEGVNLARMTGEVADSSTFSLTLTAEVEGAAVEDLRVRVHMNLLPSSYRQFRLQEGRMALDLHAGRLQVKGSLASNAGRASWDVSGMPLATEPAWTLHTLTLRDVQAGVLLDNPAISSSLHARFQGELQGMGEALRMRLQGEVLPSRFQAQAIEQGSLNLTMEAGRLEGAVSLRMPESLIDLRLQATPLDDVPYLALDPLRFERVNLGAWMGNPDWTTRLSGEVRLSGRGFRLPEAAWTAAITLTPSRIGKARVTGGVLRLRLQQDSLRVAGALEAAGGQVRLQGQGARLSTAPVTEASLEVNRLNLAALMGMSHASSLSLRARMVARKEVEGFRLEGAVERGEGYWGRVRLDALLARVEATPEVILLDTLLLRSNVVQLDGGGRIGLRLKETSIDNDFRLKGVLGDVHVLGDVVSLPPLGVGTGAFEVRLTGPSGAPRFEGGLRLEQVLYDTYRVAALEDRFTGQYEEGQWRLSNRLHADYLKLGERLIRRVEHVLDWEREHARMNLRVRVDEANRIRAAVRVDGEADTWKVMLDTLQMDLGPTRWALLLPASITSEGEAWEIRNFLLYAGDQQIAVDGSVSFTGMENLVVTIEQVELEPFVQLLALPEMRGVLNGALVLEGTADAPEMEANLYVNRWQIPDAPAMDTRVDLRYGADRLYMHTIVEQPGGVLTVGGFYPLRFTLSEGMDLLTEDSLAFDVRVQDVAIEGVRPFLDPALVFDVGGILEGRIQARGTPAEPLIDGNLRWRHGRLGLTDMGTTYRDIRTVVRLQGATVYIDTLFARGGEGTLQGEGRVELYLLRPDSLHLQMRMDRFRGIHNRTYQVVASGRLEIDGRAEAPRVRGSLTVAPADIYYTEALMAEEVEEVTLTEEDIRQLEMLFGIHVGATDTTTFDFYEASTMELELRLERDVWFHSARNPVMDVELRGNLTFIKEAYADPLLYGTVRVVTDRSRVEFLGKRFELERGTFTFDGPVDDPVLDLEARYRVPARTSVEDQVVITLAIQGRLSRPDVQLQSTPTMSLADMIAYLAIGRPASGNALGGFEGTSQLETLSMAQLAALVERLARSTLGLDVVEITYDPVLGSVLSAGKYVSLRIDDGFSIDRLYIGITQPVGLGGGGQAQAAQQRALLEYELYRDLLLRLVLQSASVQVNLLWEYGF